MCKIRLVPTLDPLHGRVEIAEPYPWKFFPYQFHGLFDPQEFPRICGAYPAHVPVRVDVKVAPLDHGKVGFTDELAQGFIFFHTVGHARESEIIDGCPASEAAHHFQTFHDVFEAIVIRAVICLINGRPGGVHAYPDGVQPRFAERSYGGGFAAVGIDIDAAPARVLAHFKNGFPDGFPHQQRLAFTALSKTDDGIGGCLQMGDREFHDLFRQWFEGQPVLRGGNGFLLRLEGNAADAIGVAGR